MGAGHGAPWGPAHKMLQDGLNGIEKWSELHFSEVALAPVQGTDGSRDRGGSRGSSWEPGQ